MAYRSFRQFLDALEQAGELQRVTIPVDTELLIAEWADREMKSPGGGKALLFEQPIVDGKKSEFPVAINTMGSRRRMAMALQVSDVEDVAREIQLILKAKPPTDLREGWNLLKQGIHLLHARPKSVRDAPCQEVVHRAWRRLVVARSADPQMLAERRRAFRHPGKCAYAGSGNRRSQCGHLPNASVRRAYDGDALATS
jgi:3-polyprenyl-4-hydroxybenzoate decarboxylase